MKINLLLFYCTVFISNCTANTINLVGPFKYRDGLGRIPIVFVEMLKNDFQIKCIPTVYINEEIPLSVETIVKNTSIKPGKISIFFDLLGDTVKLIPEDSTIKIAYSMFESSLIPKSWVIKLNENFDCVVVPDQFLIKVYLDSGVNIPIFVLPVPLFLEDYLNTTIKRTKNTEFVFGMSNGFFTNRKNHLLLLKAFAEEFGNQKNVKLRMHWQPRGPQELMFHKKAKRIAKHFKNIELIRKFMTKEEHRDFMSSLHCYVLPSRGEGYSNTPREASAMELPVILTNNSAHQTICETGLVLPITCNILEPAYYEVFRRTIGYQYNCEIKNLKKALREMYENYQIYLDKAKKAKEWAKQYDYKNLAKFFKTLFNPNNIELGLENSVLENKLVTSSEILFNKYKLLKSTHSEN